MGTLSDKQEEEIIKQAVDYADPKTHDYADKHFNKQEPDMDEVNKVSKKMEEKAAEAEQKEKDIEGELNCFSKKAEKVAKKVDKEAKQAMKEADETKAEVVETKKIVE